MAKVEEMGSGLMKDTAKAVSFEDSLKGNPCWEAWLKVKPLLKAYGVLPYKNGKGSYALYVWDRECQELSDFWHSFTKEDRKDCGLTAHMKEDVLYIYEMGFAIKAKPKTKTGRKSSTGQDVPAYAKEQARRDSLTKMSLPRLIFKALIGKRLENFRKRLIDSLM